MKQKKTIPTILGVIVLLLGSLAGVFLMNSSQIFQIGADVTTYAKNIRVANLSDDSFTLSWTTDKETKGYIIWGTSENNIDNIAYEDTSENKYLSHTVNVTGLKASTKYFYKINSDDTTFDNSGIPWQVTTGPTLSSNKSSVLISGSVIDASGQPESKALVYADIEGYLMETETSDTGNFVFQLNRARNNNLQSYASIDPEQTVIQISVQSAKNGVASAQIFSKSANPIPPIIIGQTHDFRNSPANSLGGNPNSNLNLPQDNPQNSKFNVTIPSETAKPTSIILESLNEGEIITSTKPQFFGKGPSGTTLTITVHSENPVTSDVKVPKSGSWSYTIPTNLEEGNHTITISWIDVSGITRFLTRDFVVKAGEIPAFTASSSGVTPTPAASNKPSATTKPTSTPTASSSATAMPVPVTGDLTPTLALFIMSLIVLIFSFTIWKVSEN